MLTGSRRHNVLENCVPAISRNRPREEDISKNCAELAIYHEGIELDVGDTKYLDIVAATSPLLPRKSGELLIGGRPRALAVKCP